MYAVIESGGKQLRVQAGDIVQIEKLEGEAGSKIQFDQVLFVSKPAQQDGQSQIWVGKPYLSGASVQGEIVSQGRGEKILIIKMKRRKQYRRTQGHRQEYTHVLVTGLANGAGENVTLDSAQRTKIMSKYQSPLKPKGLAFTAAKSTQPKVKAAVESKKAEAAPKAKTKKATTKKA